MSINLAAVGVVPTAHDAATSKRYLEARLTWQEIRDHHLAALGETK